MLTLCLQFHEADKPQAMELARFVADLERRPRDDVEFLFSRRFDCTQCLETFAYVAKKFPISTFKGPPHEVGWPQGPNGLALATMREIYHRQDSPCSHNISGVLLMEPDDVPLARDWIDQLKAEWEIARENGAWIMGSVRQPAGHPYPHCNGNCVIRPDFAALVDINRVPPGFAWDCSVAPQLQGRMHATGLIRNDFQSRGATEELLRTPEVGTVRPVLSHGFKDRSAMEIARRWTL